MTNILIKKIAQNIGNCESAIYIGIAISDEDQDRNRDFNFGDQGHALTIIYFHF